MRDLIVTCTHIGSMNHDSTVDTIDLGRTIAALPGQGAPLGGTGGGAAPIPEPGSVDVPLGAAALASRRRREASTPSLRE